MAHLQKMAHFQMVSILTDGGAIQTVKNEQTRHTYTAHIQKVALSQTVVHLQTVTVKLQEEESLSISALYVPVSEILMFLMVRVYLHPSWSQENLKTSMG